MKPTIKQLQEVIKEKDAALKYYFRWRETLVGIAKDQIDLITRQGKTIKDLRARIKFLTNSIAALQKDYDKLKRKRK